MTSHHKKTPVVRYLDTFFFSLGWAILMILMLPILCVLMLVDYVYPTRFPSEQVEEAEEEEE